MKLFNLIFAIIVFIFVLFVTLTVRRNKDGKTSRIMIVVSIVQGLNVIWSITRITGLLP